MYNSTILTFHADGSPRSACVAEVHEGIVHKTNGLSCTGVDGKPAYHARFLGTLPGGVAFKVVPGTGAYREFLFGGRR